MRILCIIAYLLVSSFKLFPQPVLITEVMSRNGDVLSDEQGRFPDWIELFNAGNQVVNLEGFGLSDDPEVPFAHVLPSIRLNPGDHWVVFCSGETEQTLMGVESKWNLPDWGLSFPPVKSGLVLHLDAADARSVSALGDGRVLAWLDRGPLGLHASAPNFANTTFYREEDPLKTPSIFFNGEGAYLEMQEVLGRTLFLVASEHPHASNHHRVVLGHHEDFPLVRGNDRKILNDVWGGAYEAKGVHLNGQRIDPSTTSFPQCISLLRFESNQHQTFSLIGSDRLLDNRFWHGSVHEIQLFNRSLAPAETRMVEAYLNQKWRLPRTYIHAPFKISDRTTLLLLTSPEGNLCDRFAIQSTPKNVSQVKDPVSGEQAVTDMPTPGTSNNQQTFTSILRPPQFSQPAGFYDTAIELLLSHDDPGVNVRFTTNGSEPSESDPVFQGPIRIRQTQVLKARAFREGFLPSSVETASYVMSFASQIPVVSLSGDPDAWFSDARGMYVTGPGASAELPYFGANFWKEWEVPTTVDWLDRDPAKSWQQLLGAKIHGGWSRANPQKSIALIARARYGEKRIKGNPFFHENSNAAKQLLLRNGGNDWRKAMLRDPILHLLADRMGMVSQAYRPVHGFINGEYFGLFNLRERANEHFLAAKAKLLPQEIEMVDGFLTPIHGNHNSIQKAFDWLRSQDPDQTDFFDRLIRRFDIDQFIDYLAIQIYAANKDWPHNNVTLWRPSGPDGRIRWMLNDLDMSMGWHRGEYDDSTFSRLLARDETAPSSMFGLCLKNQEFKEYFAKRLLFRLENDLSPAKVISLIDDVSFHVRGEMRPHIKRWGRVNLGGLSVPETIEAWDAQVQALRNYALHRNAYLRKHLSAWLSLEEPVLMQVLKEGGGVGSLEIDGMAMEFDEKGLWESHVFMEYAMQLEVKTDPQSYFLGWGHQTGPQATIRVQPSQLSQIKVFVEPKIEAPAVRTAGKVLINEIMYHPLEGSNQVEFIELINADTHPIQLQGWRLTGGVKFVIPEYILLPGQMLVLAEHLPLVQGTLNDLGNPIEWMGPWEGRLSNQGELLRLLDFEGNEVDAVAYADEGEWAKRMLGPEDHGYRGWVWSNQHDGLGSSLERQSLEVAGAYGQNWLPSFAAGGTPGSRNGRSKSVIAPIIRKLEHWPPVPRSDEKVWVSAKVVSGGSRIGEVKLFYRYQSGGSFLSIAMRDDGMNQDRASGDGVYGAWLPEAADQVICEFYVRATDAAGNFRHCPAETDQGQVANAYYQVDDHWHEADATLPTLRVITSLKDRDRLSAIGKLPWNASSDAQLNATFLCHEQGQWEVRYGVGLRLRGSTSRSGYPKNRRINFASDHPWRERLGVALNAVNVPSQVLGAAFYRQVGLPVAPSRPVRWLENGQNLANPGFPQFGCYAQVDLLDGEFVDHFFADDNEGQLYRPSGNGNLEYLGEDPSSYARPGFYAKGNRKEANDWSDLIALTRHLSKDDPDAFSLGLESVVHQALWLKYFAMDALLANTETSFANGGAGDYAFFIGSKDPRAILIPYDLDSILGMGVVMNHLSIRRAAAKEVPRRFLGHPSIAPLYFAELEHLSDTLFHPSRLADFVGQVLGSWTSREFVEQTVQFALTRKKEVREQLQDQLTVDVNLPFAEPAWLRYYQAPSESMSLSGSSDLIQTHRVRVAGEEALWLPWVGKWQIDGVALHPGVNEITVESFDENERLQDSKRVLVYRETEKASIPHGGVLEADTLWKASQSPIVVQQNLVIPKGVTLQIEAGTTVELNQGAGLIVHGNLLVKGRSNKRIVFTRNRFETTRWGGIHLDQSMEGNKIEHVTFEWSESPGIRLTDSQCDIQNIKWIGAYRSFLRTDGSSLHLKDSEFPDVTNGEPISGYGIPEAGYWIVENCVFGKTTGYADVIDFTGGKLPGPVPQFLYNRFLGGSDDGLDLDGADAYIEGNWFSNFHKANGSDSESHAVATGVYNGVSSNISLIRNVFLNNDHDLLLKEWSSAYAAHNTFVGSRLGSVSFMELVRRTQPPVSLEMEGNIFQDTKVLHALSDALVLNPKISVRIDSSLMPEMWHAYGSGNVSGDPAFVDLVGGDVQLKAHSPAIGIASLGFDAGAEVPSGVAIGGNQVKGVAVGRQLDIQVGGAGIHSYRYRLDYGDWSATMSVAQTLRLDEMGDGWHHVEFMGQNRAGNWLDLPEQIRKVDWLRSNETTPIRFSEVFAHSVPWHDDAIMRSEFVELVNLESVRIVLDDYSITDDAQNPSKFQFSPQSLVEARQRFVVGAGSVHSDQGFELPFGLDNKGEGLYLFKRVGDVHQLVDHLVYGRQIPGWSLGRDPQGAWRLGAPTPGFGNQIARMGETETAWVSEWATSGDSNHDNGFIELSNESDYPLDISQWSLQLTPKFLGAGISIPRLSFMAPHETFLLKPHDGLVESLPVSQREVGGLMLSNGEGRVLDHMAFFNPVPDTSFQREGAPAGYLWQRSQTPSFILQNTIFPEIVIYEVMADNRDTMSPWSTFCDWVELRNEGQTAIDLSHWALTDNPENPSKFVLNGHEDLLPGELRLVWLDGNAPPHRWNAGFGLKARGDQLWLVDLTDALKPRFADGLVFGWQTPDGSLIRHSENQQWHLGRPTPGTPNELHRMGSVDALRINEWMAKPEQGEDWLELVHTGQEPVRMDGCMLSDDPQIRNSFTFPPLSFMGTGLFGFWVGEALGQGAEEFQLPFKLSGDSDSIFLFDPSGDIVDRVDYGAQTRGVSMGRVAGMLDGMVPLAEGGTPGKDNRQDTDGDGFSDEWEITFGMDPFMPEAFVLDTDGDGMTNKDEFNAGTNPLDPSDRLEMHSVSFHAYGISFGFQVKSAQSYRLEGSSDLREWQSLWDVKPMKTQRTVHATLEFPETASIRFFRLTTE